MRAINYYKAKVFLPKLFGPTHMSTNITIALCFTRYFHETGTNVQTLTFVKSYEFYTKLGINVKRSISY